MYQDLLEQKEKLNKPIKTRKKKRRVLKYNTNSVNNAGQEYVRQSQLFNRQTSTHFSDFAKIGSAFTTGLKFITNTLKTEQTLILLGAVALIGLVAFLKKGDLSGSGGTGGEDYSPSDRSSGKMSEKGVHDLLQYESFRGEAYQDSGGVWTIGYGHTGNVKPGDKITRDQAKELFKKDLARFEKVVNESVKVPISQNQFDALVSLAYNIGPGAFKNSTLLAKLNKGDYLGAAQEFAKWNKDEKGNVLGGLTKRRAKEADLFKVDVSSDNKLIKPEVNPLNTKVNLNYKGKYYNGDGKGTATWGGKRITSQYKEKDSMHTNTFGHTGIDIAYKTNEPVYAFIGGTVVKCGTMSGFGIAVCIRDAKNYTHVYGHLNKHVVTNGQSIKTGQLIGYAGSTGRSSGTHLHYGIWKPNTMSDGGGKNTVDPRTYDYAAVDPTLQTQITNKPKPVTKQPTKQPTKTNNNNNKNQTKSGNANVNNNNKNNNKNNINTSSVYNKNLKQNHQQQVKKNRK